MSGEIKSPCINVCEIDDGGLCAGCMRTVEEIRAWKAAPQREKAAIVARAEKRRKGKEG